MSGGDSRASGSALCPSAHTCFAALRKQESTPHRCARRCRPACQGPEGATAGRALTGIVDPTWCFSKSLARGDAHACTCVHVSVYASA